MSWFDALRKTRDTLAGAFSRVLGREPTTDEAGWEELEALLLRADVPVRLAGDIVAALQKVRAGRKEALRRVLIEALPEHPPFEWPVGPRPFVIFIAGVNGSGKTTTCAKLARNAMAAGLKPILGATDTFRAAGSEQLHWWARKLGCEAVVGATGADAAAVAYDAMDAALARACDTLIIDTAGRMHTKAPLMQELVKTRAAIAKRMPDAPHATWIVLDASIGQNAVQQARVFHQAVPLSGAIVTKLDGSSKGGFLFAVAGELKIPIYFTGLGEGDEDLAPFRRESFVDALLG